MSATTTSGLDMFNFISPIKFLFFNLSLQSRLHMIALLFFFQKRYRDLKCCTYWLSDKQNHGVNPHCSEEFSHFRRVVVLTQPPFSHTKTRRKCPYIPAATMLHMIYFQSSVIFVIFCLRTQMMSHYLGSNIFREVSFLMRSHIFREISFPRKASTK